MEAKAGAMRASSGSISDDMEQELEELPIGNESARRPPGCGEQNVVHNAGKSRDNDEAVIKLSRRDESLRA
jgi:hypothetical protein